MLIRPLRELQPNICDEPNVGHVGADDDPDKVEKNSFNDCNS